MIVGDLNAANLVYYSNSRGGPRLLMVDGFGEKSVVPLSSMSPWLNRHFIRRRYRRMLRHLARPVATWSMPRTDPRGDDSVAGVDIGAFASFGYAARDHRVGAEEPPLPPVGTSELVGFRLVHTVAHGIFETENPT